MSKMVPQPYPLWASYVELHDGLGFVASHGRVIGWVPHHNYPGARNPVVVDCIGSTGGREVDCEFLQLHDDRGDAYDGERSLREAYRDEPKPEPEDLTGPEGDQWRTEDAPVTS